MVDGGCSYVLTIVANTLKIHQNLQQNSTTKLQENVNIVLYLYCPWHPLIQEKVDFETGQCCGLKPINTASGPL